MSLILPRGKRDVLSDYIRTFSEPESDGSELVYFGLFIV